MIRKILMIGAFFILILIWAFHELGESYYNKPIKQLTKIIKTSRDTSQLAEAYTRRGKIYGDKAIYTRYKKSGITKEESERLLDLAFKDYDKAFELTPNDPDVYCSRGETYALIAGQLRPPESQKYYQQAETDFQKALEIDANYGRAFYGLGGVHLSQGHYDDALAYFYKAMEWNPSWVKSALGSAYCQRAVFYQRQGQYNEAIADYKKAIEDAPECDCDPHQSIAYLYFHQKDYDRSWETIHQAEEVKEWIDPKLIEDLQIASGREK